MERTEDVRVNEFTSENAVVSHRPSIFTRFYRLFSGGYSRNGELSYLVLSPDRELPLQYRDCLNYDEKCRWIESDRGQLILSQRPILKEYYKNQRLYRLMKNTHWEQKLNEWLFIVDDGSDVVPFGVNLPVPRPLAPRKNVQLSTSNNPPIPVMFANHSEFLKPAEFPLSAKLNFLTDGYTIFEHVVSPEIVDAAVCAIARMITESPDFNIPLSERLKSRENGDPFFTTGGTNHKDVLALYYCSPVYALVESILHNEAASLGKFQGRVHGAQVAFRFSEGGGIHARSKMGGRSWHLDGMEKGIYGPFSLLIGVALSDQLTDFCGNLAVHPGSHYSLSSFLKEYATICDHSRIDQNNPEIVQNQRLLGVDLLQKRPTFPDEPVQIKLRKGDVVMALHKVAHLGVPNYSNDIRKMVYFRVSHRNLQKIRWDALDNIWIEYEGMGEVL